MESKFISKVFKWMFIGLLITFATAYVTATTQSILNFVFGTGFFYVLIIGELVIVTVLAARVNKMEPTTAKLLFCAYSVVSGLTFSSIFVLYEMASIVFLFMVAALVFGLFAFIGSVTKIDLTRFSTIIMMSLFGIVILAIINIFLNSPTLDLFLSWVGLILFMGITAYDMQKLKAYASIGTDNLAILGALDLYLDFINIFIKLLNLFGKRRD